MRIAALLVAVAMTCGVAQADRASAQQQALLLLRVVAYDRNLKARAGDSVVVGVMYRKGKAESEGPATEMVSALQEIAARTKIGGLPLKVQSIAWTEGKPVEAQLGGAKLTALYVAPGMNDVVVSIAAAARTLKIVTAANKEGFIKGRLSVGIITDRGDGRMNLLLNLKASKEEGAQFDPAVIRTAEVID